MGGKDTTTVTKNEPWAAAKPYYENLYSSAQNAFNLTNNKPYTGQTYAGPNATQQGAVDQVKALAPTLSEGADPLRELALSQIRGDWLSPDTNPYIRDVADAALRPVQSAFDKNKLAMADRAIMSGAYGGARQDLQQNELVDQFTRTSGDITSALYGQNYANERGIQQNSGGLLDIANALKLAGPTALANAGDVEQGWSQAALDDAFAKYQRDQQAPWTGVGEMSNVLSAGGFGEQQSKAPTASPFTQILQGLMGGASTGASLASGIGGVAAGAGLGAFAPWMIPLALAGGLAGGMG